MVTRSTLLIKLLSKHYMIKSQIISQKKVPNAVRNFIDLTFSGNTADRTVKNGIKKLYKCFKKHFIIKFLS